MSQESSPFLYRDSNQDWRSWVRTDESNTAQIEQAKQLAAAERLGWYVPELRTYAERIIPSEYAQKLKIETYRYRWYQRNGTLGRFLQGVGDWALGKNRGFLSYGSRWGKS